MTITIREKNAGNNYSYSKKDEKNTGKSYPTGTIKITQIKPEQPVPQPVSQQPQSSQLAALDAAMQSRSPNVDDMLRTAGVDPTGPYSAPQATRDAYLHSIGINPVRTPAAPLVDEKRQPAYQLPAPVGTDPELDAYVSGIQRNTDAAFAMNPNPRFGRAIEGGLQGTAAGTINYAATTLDEIAAEAQRAQAFANQRQGWDVSGQAAPVSTGDDELDAYLNGITAQAEAATARNTGDPASFAANRAQNERLYQKADEYKAASTKNIEEAKNGLGAVGRFAVDTVSNAAQMAGDLALNLVVPGTGLAALGARAAGSAMQDARERGKTLAQQFGYGNAVGALEVISESIFGVFAPAYGAGAADDIFEGLIKRMAKSDAGEYLLKIGFSGLEEALEEVISGVGQPVLKAILGDKVQYNADTWSDILYSMLVAGVLGAAGGATNVVTETWAKDSAEKNADPKKMYRGKWFKEGMSLEEANTLRKELARKYHPDLNQGSPEAAKTFAEINAEYDRFVQLFGNKAAGQKTSTPAQTANGSMIDLLPAPYTQQNAQPTADTTAQRTAQNASESATSASDILPAPAAQNMTPSAPTQEGGTRVTVTAGPSALEAGKGVAYTLASNIKNLEGMPVLKSLTGLEMNDRTMKPSEQIAAFFKRIGNRVHRQGLGDVLFGEYGVGGMINHRPLNRAKMVSLTAAPEVIRDGKMISFEENWKGRGYDSMVFAGPVTIGDRTVYVAAVVNRDQNNRFYMSEAVDSDGNYVRISESPSDNTKTGVTAQGGVTGGPNGLSTEETAQGGAPSLAGNAAVSSDASTVSQSGAEVNPLANETEVQEGFTGKSGQRWTEEQSKALASIPNAGIQNVGDVATGMPITANVLGLNTDSDEWKALERAGLVDEDGGLIDSAAWDERARRHEAEKAQKASLGAQPVANQNEQVYNIPTTNEEGVANGRGEETDGGRGRHLGAGAGSLRSQQLGEAQRAGGVVEATEGDREGSPARRDAQEAQRPGGAQSEGGENSAGAREGTERERDRVAKDPGVKNTTPGQEVGPEFFKLKDADNSKRVHLLGSGTTKHIDNARAIANGTKLYLFGGGYLVSSKGTPVEAFHHNSGNFIAARYDDPAFTCDRLTGHEKCHELIDDGTIDAYRAFAVASSSFPPAVLNDVLGVYGYLYPEKSSGECLVELVCDAAGLMNRPRAYGWGGVDTFIEQLDSVLNTIHEYLNDITDDAFVRVPALDYIEETDSLDTAEELGNAMIDTMEAGDISDSIDYSYRSLADAAGFKAIEENGARGFARKDGTPVKKVTADDIRQSPIGALIKFAQDEGFLGATADENRANADKQVKFFADVCTLAAKNNDFAMSMQLVGAETFTAIKSNSDTQYGTTYDFKSVCIKTQSCIDSMSAAMVAKKGGLTKDEILDIYRTVNEIGLPVPCPECYVWNRWVGIGGLLDNMWKYQERYGAMSFDEVKAAYDKMHDRVAAKAEEAGLSFGKAKTKLSQQITKEYQKQLDKVEKTINRGDRVSKADEGKLKTLESTMTDVKSLTWIETVYFGGKPMTAENVSKNYRVPAEILFDLNRGAEFSTQYKDAWAFRTTQGAGYGKAITPYSEAALGEGILGTNSISKTVKDKAAGKLNNPFLNNNGDLTDDAKRKLRNAVRKQKVQLFRGGQRFNSTSDAGNDVASDYLLAMLEMQSMNGGVQVYTKVDGSVQYLSNVGAFINQSLMPLGSGLDENGKLRDTTIGGMSPKAAFANRKKYENAGTITIGVNDEHIRALYRDPQRDFVIPYHISGGDAAVVAEMRAIQDPQSGSAARVRSSDYTRTQNEKLLSDVVLKSLGKDDTEIEQIKKNREARVAILTRGKPDMAVVRANPILSNLYDLFNGGIWDGVKLPKSEIESHIYPNEFWDTEADYEHSGINTELYLQYCDDLGMLHKFSGKVPSNGKLVPVKGYDSHGNRVDLQDTAYLYKDGEATDQIEEYYWKSLVDHRMYGNQGQYLPQTAINLSGLGVNTVTEFAKKNSGRVYDKALSEKAAEAVREKFSGEEDKIDYSLVPVNPVQPSSNFWKRSSTYSEVKAAHPTLYDLAADENEVRNPTQVTVTKSTYRKIYNILKDEGFSGSILDASSGLGAGTEVGRSEFGFNVEDIEPYPDKSYKPMYTDYSALDKTYDVIISNAVLNVLPQDLRDDLTVKMGEMMKPGGRMFVNVRGNDVLNAKSKIPIDADQMEYFIADGASYQKGFTPKELKAYLEDALGDGYTVKLTTKFGKVSAIVTRDDSSASQLDDDYMKAVNSGDMETAQRMVDEAAERAFPDSKVRDEDGNLLMVYHGGEKNYTVFDRTKGRSTMDIQGTFFSPWELDAQGYGTNVRRFFLNITNPADEGTGYRALNRYKGQNYAGIKAREYLESRGYDGVNNNGEEYIAFDSNQIKLADPVTYDDDGNIIPLSERFNTKNDDIRYSTVPNLARIEQENNNLRERLEAAKAQTKLTRGFKAKDEDVKRVASDLIESTQSTVSSAFVERGIRGIVEMAANGEVTTEEIETAANQLARQIIDQSAPLVSKDETAYNAAKSYLKKVYIKVPTELREQFADYQAFAKANPEMRMRTEGVDVYVAYEALQRELGKDLFPVGLGTEKDMLEHMSEVLESLKPVLENQYSFGMAVVTQELSNDILESVLDIRQAAPTFADKAKARENAAKAETREAVKKLKTAESYIQAIQKTATRRAEQMEALRAHYAETKKRQSELKKEREDRQRLLRVYRRLNNRKLPQLTRAEIDRIAGELDNIAVSITDRKIVEAKNLYDFIRDKTDKDRNSELYDPDFIVDGRTKRTAERWEKTQISQLTIQDVRERLQALLNIEARLAAEKKFVNSQLDMMFEHAAQRVMDDLAATRPGSITSLLRPTTAALRITYNERSPLNIAMREMVRGEEKADLYKREAMKPFNKFLEDKKFATESYGPKAKTVKITGIDAQTGKETTVEITPMMRISLYLHSLNEDNYRHVYKGGIVIPDMEYYRKGKLTEANNAGRTIKLSRTQLQRIAEQMTQQERDFAKALQWYFNEYAPQHMNRTSVALDGYEKFLTEDYYPITVDRNFLHSDFESMVSQGDASLARPGFGEERIHSPKPIVLYDASSLLFDMINRNAAYACQAVPLHNMTRLLNMEFDKAGMSVKKSMNQAFPDGSALEYLNNYISDYGGHKRIKKSKLDKVGSTVDKVRNNYAGGVLTLAASTAFVQFASYPTAATILDTSALAKALAPVKVDTSFIDKKTAVFTKRTEGFSTLELAELKERGTPIPKALNWIQGVDVFTTTLLKRAAYYHVRQNRPTLEPGTEAFEKAVTDLYIRVIEETQPNYSVALRPEIQRNPNPATRSLIMFVTQPLQQFNLMYEAGVKLDMAQRADRIESTPQTQKAVKEAKKGFSKVASSLLASSFLYALLKLAANGIMGKYKKRYGPQSEDDDPVWAFIRRFGGDMRSAITGMIPLLNSAITLMEYGVDRALKNAGKKPIFYTNWYGLEVSAISAISDALKDSADAFASLAAMDDRKGVVKAAKKFINAAEDWALLLGIPAQKAHEDLIAMASWFGITEDEIWELLEG